MFFLYLLLFAMQATSQNTSIGSGYDPLAKGELLDFNIFMNDWGGKSRIAYDRLFKNNHTIVKVKPFSQGILEERIFESKYEFISDLSSFKRIGTRIDKDGLGNGALVLLARKDAIYRLRKNKETGQFALEDSNILPIDSQYKDSNLPFYKIENSGFQLGLGLGLTCFGKNDTFYDHVNQTVKTSKYSSLNAEKIIDNGVHAIKLTLSISVPDPSSPKKTINYRDIYWLAETTYLCYRHLESRAVDFSSGELWELESRNIDNLDKFVPVRSTFFTFNNPVPKAIRLGHEVLVEKFEHVTPDPKEFLLDQYNMPELSPNAPGQVSKWRTVLIIAICIVISFAIIGTVFSYLLRLKKSS